MSRRDGEVWISKQEPHTLKYSATDIEYWAVSAATYIAGEDIKKGQILAINKSDAGASGKVLKAKWPDDAGDVIGVALNDALSTFEVRVLNYGYMEFTRAELENLFVTQSDITVGSILTGSNYYSGFGTTSDGGGGNGWSNDDVTFSGNGAPIYWYQGRLLKTADAPTYEMQQPTAKDGALTFSTPSGYKYPATGAAWSEPSFDVAYEHLPIVGNVLHYTYDASDNIQSMSIHVNFSKFNKEVSFSYPSSGLYEYDAIAEEEITEIRHGLFTDSSITPYTDLAILGSSDSAIDGEIIKINPGYISTQASSKTQVTVKSDSAFFGKMTGQLRYIL